eukprot:tig00000711_g3418.t1
MSAKEQRAEQLRQQRERWMRQRAQEEDRGAHAPPAQAPAAEKQPRGPTPPRGPQQPPQQQYYAPPSQQHYAPAGGGYYAPPQHVAAPQYAAPPPYAAPYNGLPPIPNGSRTAPSPPPAAQYAAAPAGGYGRAAPAPPAPYYPELSASQVNALPEQLLDRLTERLTNRLRIELKEELRRETQPYDANTEQAAARIERHLAADVEAQTCPICYDLMVPPAKSPIILFPCGHSFCEQCVTNHTQTHQRDKCPVCRTKIASQAQNVVLRQLIQKYVAKRQQIEGGREAPGAAAGPSRVAAAPQAPGGDDPRDSYLRDYQSLGMRCRILRNEVEETVDKIGQIKQKGSSARLVREHLAREERRAYEAVQRATAEWEVVKGQLAEQEAKCAQVDASVSEAEGKIELLKSTLAPLESEREKARLILLELDPRIRLSDYDA